MLSLVPNPSPCNSAPESQSREEILAAGGHIIAPEVTSPGVDMDLIVWAPQAGKNHWKTFATSRHDLLRASKAMQMLDGLEAPQGARLPVVLPRCQATTESMQVLMDALDDEAHPTAANSVEVAALIDYLNPTAKSRWNKLQRDCKAAFLAEPMTDNKWLTQLRRLAEAPRTVTEGWADGIAQHVGNKPERLKEALVCNAEQMRHLLTSCALPLDEGERLDWANDFARHHKKAQETAGSYLARTQLNTAICWLDLPAQRLHAAWQDQALTEAQLVNVLALGKAAEEGFTLTTPAFGRPKATSRPAKPIGELSPFDNPAQRNFGGVLRLADFAASYRGQTLEGATFWAAGNSWRIEVRAEGIQLRAISGPYFRGHLSCGVLHAGTNTWLMGNAVDFYNFLPPDAPLPVEGGSPALYLPWNKIKDGLTIDEMRAGSSRWLAQGRDLSVIATLQY